MRINVYRITITQNNVYIIPAIHYTAPHRCTSAPDHARRRGQCPARPGDAGNGATPRELNDLPPEPFLPPLHIAQITIYV